jgi:hypothetical protein
VAVIRVDRRRCAPHNHGIGCVAGGTAEQARAAMMGKLKLTLNQQKTRICRVPKKIAAKRFSRIKRLGKRRLET